MRLPTRLKMKNAIFDLDGTLVHSLPGIELSVRHAISRILPREQMPSLEKVIGPPIPSIFRSLWPEASPCRIDGLVKEFREHYLDKGCLNASLYPGVAETLVRLHYSGRRMFVLTNKPLAPAQKMLRNLGVDRLLTALLSPDSQECPFLEKSERARFLMNKFALEPGETLLLGDSADDAKAARDCSFLFVGAAYGYGNAAVRGGLQVQAFPDICELLL